MAKNLTFPAEVKQGNSPSGFSSQEASVLSLVFTAMMFALVFFLGGYFLLVILVFKLAPEHGIKIPYGALEHEKAVTCLPENSPVLDKPYSGMSST